MGPTTEFKPFFSAAPASRLAAWLLVGLALLCLALVGYRIRKGPEWGRPPGASVRPAGGERPELRDEPATDPSSAPEPARPGGFLREKLKRFGHNPYRVLATATGLLLLAYVLGRGIGNTRRDWPAFAGRMVLLMLGLGVSVGAGEVAVRILLFAQQKANSIEQLARYQRGEPIKVRGTHPLCAIITASANTSLVYELRQGLDQDFGHRRVRTNRHGMRDSREYAAERLTNSARIVGIGDSGMFGWNVEQDLDYLSVLESNLNARADGVVYEALNLAVPGYNTAQEVEMLACKGLAFKPDVVVVGWSWNDFDMPFCVIQEQNFRRKDVSFLHLFFFDQPKLRDACYVGVADSRKYERGRVSRNLEELSGVEGAKHSLRRAKAMAEENRFRLLIFGPLEERIIAICRELRLDCYDTFERIPEGKYPAAYAIHSFHPKPEGHRVLAEHLETDLRERGWLEPKLCRK
ncbi:MAG: SGNH/GDSL hydrolase family protein [Verrucomicrobiota bacterium]|nr:SGNH/GDSL hydrolase family protein [Verrucomicrobiota bacterium]